MNRVLYVRMFDTHVLFIEYMPFWRTPLGPGDGWWKWHRFFRLEEPAWGVGAWAEVKTSTPASSRFTGAECYEPNEVLDSDIREANSWAECLMHAQGLV